MKNFRGTHTYNIEGVGEVILVTDKNFSVHSVSPKFVKTSDGIVHNVLNECRGQIPSMAAQSIANSVYKWQIESTKYGRL